MVKDLGLSTPRGEFKSLIPYQFYGVVAIMATALDCQSSSRRDRYPSAPPILLWARVTLRRNRVVQRTCGHCRLKATNPTLQPPIFYARRSFSGRTFRSERKS